MTAPATEPPKHWMNRTVAGGILADAMARLLRPGAALCMATINRNPKSWLYAIVGVEYVLRLRGLGGEMKTDR